MKKNLYDKCKERKEGDYSLHINNKKVMATNKDSISSILSFISDMGSRVFRIIVYIILILLCSTGATYILKYIFHFNISL